MSETAQTWLTPHGNPVYILQRDDTADGALVAGLIARDEYGLHDLDDLAGVALDVGAHIGAVALTLLADHPGLRVVAVEPLAENVDVLRRAGANWLGEGRLIVLEAAAVAPGTATATISYDYTSAKADAGYVHQNRFIGGMWREDYEGKHVTVPGYSLRALAREFVPDGAGFRLLKIDAEGAEYPFLSDGAELVQTIIGEWHDGGPERITALLAGTHDLTILDDNGGTGIFRAERR